MPDALPFPPPPGLSGLSAQLRAERRIDEREWIRVASQRWVHARRLADLAREYASRGDRVAVDVARCRFEGHIDAVGDDRLDLRTPCSVVTVRTAFDETCGALPAPVVLWRVATARAGGRRVPPALVTFRARLLELEERGAAVRVGSVLFAEELRGPVAVGRDHLVVAGPTEIVVPTGWVGYVAVDEPAVVG